MEGLIDRFNIANAPQKGRKQAADLSFEQLRVKAEALLGEKTITYDALSRDYEKVANGIEVAAGDQATDFSDAQTLRETDFQKLVTEHKEEME